MKELISIVRLGKRGPWGRWSFGETRVSCFTYLGNLHVIEMMLYNNSYLNLDIHELSFPSFASSFIYISDNIKSCFHAFPDVLYLLFYDTSW